FHCLQLVAARTRELIIVNTAARNDRADGMLMAVQEGTDNPMSGVYGLAWLPTGPDVISKMLMSMGFPATRTTFWKRNLNRLPDRGRLEVIGARDESVFAHYDEIQRKRETRKTSVSA